MIVLKVSTYMITSITACPLGLDAMPVVNVCLTFKTHIIAFIDNMIM